MHESGESQKADLFDFVDEFLSDREKGRDLPLAHYLARYPRCQEDVAREYLALKVPREDEPKSRLHGRDTAGPEDVSQRVGPYRILSEIGRGGQGAVFLAEDTRIARKVALKVLASRFDLVSEERRRRFRREAEVIARLEHPGICGIFEADIEGDTPYIAMRLIEGRSLAQILAEARANAAPASAVSKSGADAGDSETTWPPRQPLEVRRVLLLFERIARALHAAHEAGVVHRDVKPGNVLVAKDGSPVLLDFGLARDEQSELATLTQSGDVFGTPAYMSPEQLAGGGAPLDRRTDVYSLAVSLYEALTLERPFEAPSRMELYRRILEQPMPDPRARNAAVSEDVKVVIETALERDRARRYATALDFAEDLRRIREYEPIHARPAGPLLRFSRWTRRHPVLAVAIIGTILALSSGLAMALHLLEKRDQALAQADSALEIALGRHLADRCTALIAEDPAAALAVGIEAADREIRQTGTEKGANYLTRSALFDALDACWLERPLSGEPGRAVTDAAVSPDGRRLALASGEIDSSRPPVQVARVFDLDTGQRLLELAGHSRLITRILYFPDGRRIATACSDGKARIFDALTGALERALDAGDPIVWADLSADGSMLVAVGRGGRAWVWSTTSGACSPVLDAGEGGIVWAAFDPRGGTRLLTRASPAHAKASAATVWDASEGRAVVDLDVATSAITVCAFDPAHDLVALGSQEGNIHLFETATGKQAREPFELGASAGFISFSPDGERMLVPTNRGAEFEAMLIEIATGKSQPLAGHEGRRVVHGAFNPDGSRVATASFDRTVRVWDTRSGTELRALATRARPMAVLWTPDGDRLVTLNNDWFANVWFARSRPDLFDLVGHSGAVVRARFAPDGRSALTASTDGTARLWALPRPGSAAEEVDSEPGALLHVLRHDGPVNDACFSLDGERVLTVSSDGTARVWNARTGAPLGDPLVHPASVASGSFDALGDQVLTVCADGKARVFPPFGRTPRVMASKSGAIVCAAFDPRGEMIVCGLDGDAVEVWSANGERSLREITFEPSLLPDTGDERHRELTVERATAGGGVSAIAFDPSGRELAAACGDSRVRFWNPRTGESTRPDVAHSAGELSYSRDGSKLLVTRRFGIAAAKVLLLGENRAAVPPMVAHTASVAGGVLSADGNLVLTFARDGSAHVWEASTGRPVAYRRGGRAAILDGSFDGGIENPRVIMAREDGTVSVWPIDPLPAARLRKPRELYVHEKDRERRLALPLRFE